MSYYQHPAFSGSDIITALTKTQNEFLHFYAKRQIESIDNKTPEMEFGSLTHCLLLEPELKDEKIAISPFETFQSKESKAWKAENSNKIICKQSQFDKAQKMVDVLYNSPLAAQFLQKGINEEEVFAFDTTLSMDLRIKADKRLKQKSGSLIFEYKTTGNLIEFGNVYTNFKYYLKAAFYKHVYELQNEKINDVVLLVQSTEEPFDFEIIKVSKIDLEIGKCEFLEGLELIKKYLYNPEPKIIKLSQMKSWDKYNLMKKYNLTEAME